MRAVTEGERRTSENVATNPPPRKGRGRRRRRQKHPSGIIGVVSNQDEVTEAATTLRKLVLKSMNAVCQEMNSIGRRRGKWREMAGNGGKRRETGANYGRVSEMYRRQHSVKSYRRRSIISVIIHKEGELGETCVVDPM